MKKHVIAIILLVVLILGGLTVGAYFWVSDMMKSAAEVEEKSANIASAIHNLFSNNQSVDDYPYESANPEWNGKFLVLENRYSDTMSAIYSTKWNEILDTDKNFPGNDAKGIVMVALVVENEGTYKNTFGGDTSKSAMRQSYVISYLDIAQQKVLARDTLRGEDPPEHVGRNDSGLGDAPDEDLVVSTIQKRLK